MIVLVAVYRLLVIGLVLVGLFQLPALGMPPEAFTVIGGVLWFGLLATNQ